MGTFSYTWYLDRLGIWQASIAHYLALPTLSQTYQYGGNRDKGGTWNAYLKVRQNSLVIADCQNGILSLHDYRAINGSCVSLQLAQQLRTSSFRDRGHNRLSTVSSRALASRDIHVILHPRLIIERGCTTLHLTPRLRQSRRVYSERRARNGGGSGVSTGVWSLLQGET